MMNLATFSTLTWSCLLVLASCSRADDGPAALAVAPTAVAPDEAPAAEEAAPPEENAGEVAADGARLFGSALSDREPVRLTAIIEAPTEYDGQVVQTEGTISAVCQRMGCWMELKADEDSPAIRVPMAGHSFFLPKDVSGARATIEGTVEVRALPEDWQEHLREEGAQAADQILGINATGVLIHAG